MLPVGFPRAWCIWICASPYPQKGFHVLLPLEADPRHAHDRRGPHHPDARVAPDGAPATAIPVAEPSVNLVVAFAVDAVRVEVDHPRCVVPDHLEGFVEVVV